MNPQLLCSMKTVLRDRPLITGRGTTKQDRGADFTPTKRGGGAKKVLARLKDGGHKKFWGNLLWSCRLLLPLIN